MKITEELIKKLKKEHGEIYKVSNGNKTAIVRKPTLAELEAYQSQLAAGNMMTYNIGVFRTCCLAGDVCDQPDEEMDLISLSAKMQEVIEIKQASVEKL